MVSLCDLPLKVLIKSAYSFFFFLKFFAVASASAATAVAPVASSTVKRFDFDLLNIVLSSVCVVAAGYIINNFYYVKVDRINRPL